MEVMKCMIVTLLCIIIQVQGFQFGTQVKPKMSRTLERDKYEIALPEKLHDSRRINHHIPAVAIPEKLDALLGNTHGQILYDKRYPKFAEIAKKMEIKMEKTNEKFVHGGLANEEGSYVIDFESPSETRKEIGFVDSKGNPVKHGYFTYKTPEGGEYRVDYIADNKGFRVQGNHIPEVTIGKL